jgi:hypothetical protein
VVLQGDEESMKDFKEESFIVESRIKFLLQQNQKLECLNYCKAVKKFDQYSKILVELGRISEAVDFSINNLTSFDSLKSIILSINDIPQFTDKSKLCILCKLAFGIYKKETTQNPMDISFILKSCKIYVISGEFLQFLDDCPSIAFYTQTVVKDMITILFANKSSELEKNLLLKYVVGNPCDSYDMPLLQKIVFLSTKEEKKTIWDSISQKPLFFVSTCLSMIEVMECDDKSKSNFYQNTIVKIFKEKTIGNNLQTLKRIIPLFSNIDDLVKILIENFNPPSDPNSLFSSISSSDALLIFNQFETKEDKSVVDLMFHLIQIYSEKFYPNEEIFKISLTGVSTNYYFHEIQSFLSNPLKLKHTSHVRNEPNFMRALQNCPQLNTQLSVSNVNSKRYMPQTYTVNLTV